MVTGASSGIGAAYAEALAGHGWDLVVVARRADRLDQLARRLSDAHGVRIEAIGADLGSADGLSRVCQAVADAPLEMLINNAGLAHYMSFVELPTAQAHELLELNIAAPVLLSRAAVAGMVDRGSGSIINVASLLAFSGAAQDSFLPKRAVYAATKSFLVTFTQILAAELEPLGVRAQVVCPGVVRSEFHTRQGMDMTNVPRMEPHDVVRASLTDLDNGVVISVPGLSDTDALAELQAANGGLLRAARVTELPARYAQN